MMRDGGLQKQGEDFCWHASYYIGNFLRAWQAWQDTAWLDQGVRYYEFMPEQTAHRPRRLSGLDRPL